MLPPKTLALVPLSLLLLVADWPAQIEARYLGSLRFRNLPWKGDLPSLSMVAGKRDARLEQKPSGRRAVGARKMSDDESEMFFMEYWRFDTELDEANNIPSWQRNGLQSRRHAIYQAEGNLHELHNASIPHLLNPPFALHTEQQVVGNPIVRSLPRALSMLGERAFQCPTDTLSCISIGRPNSCCPSTEACQTITDTGNGDVGCCSQEQSCAQQVSGCQTGYTSCPGSEGGGCCIPGYACVGDGCEFSSRSIHDILLS